VNCALHVEPIVQLMPAGLLATVPLVEVVALTVTERMGGGPAGVQPELAGPFTTMWASLLVI
jgi:hypothetical protein